MSKNIVILCFVMMIFIGANADLETLHNNTRELLELCYPDHLNPVITSVDLIEIMFEISISEVANSSTVVIDGNFKSSIMKKHFTNHPTYLLSAEIDQLSLLLREIKASSIWNVASLIFIVGLNCGDAEKVLHMTWDIEALSSFYVCHQENDTLVYTFNPYTNRAPKSWMQVSVNPTADDRWSLFVQKYTKGSKCQSFQFDKHRHLDGAPVKGMTFANIENTSIVEFIPEAFQYHERDTYFVFDNIFEMMNVTPVMHYIPTTQITTAEELFESFKNGSSDVWLQTDKLNSVNKNIFDVISLYFEGGYTLITNKFSTLPIIDQIVDTTFDYQSVILSAMILVGIYVMILINNEYHFAETALDMLLLVLNMGLMTPLERTFMRITFLSASLFILMFNPALEGQLMSMLAAPSYSNIETLENLRDNKYNVFYDKFIKRDLYRTRVWSPVSAKQYLHKKDEHFYWRCNNKVLSDKTTACIFDYENLMTGIHPDLYLAKDLLFKSYDVFLTRKNWALKKKLDEAAMRLVEFGLIDYKERSSWVRHMIKKKQRTDRLEAIEGFFEQLGFENLEIVYIFMALALTWAFFIFIIEILSKKIIEYSKKQSRKRRLLRLRMKKIMAFIDRRICNDFEEV